MARASKAMEKEGTRKRKPPRTCKESKKAKKIATRSPQSSAGSSSRESTPPPLVESWGKKDIAGVDYVAALNKINYLPTPYLDESTLDMLGIQEEVMWFFAKLGLSKFISLKCDTYKDPTIQFLATVKLEFSGEYSRKSNPSEGILSFQHGDESYSMSIADLCKTFGFKKGGAFSFPHHKTFRSTWRSIADPCYTDGKIKATTIRHPALRYAHKLLANTLFDRQETNNVNNQEYFLLMKPFRNDVPEVNLGVVLACALVELRHWAHTTTVKNPTIALGGLITPILEHCGISLKGFSPIEGDNRIDLNFLANAWVIGGCIEATRKIIYQLTTPYELNALFLLPSEKLPSIQSGDPSFLPSSQELYHKSNDTPSASITFLTKKKTSEAPRVQQDSHVMPPRPNTLRSKNEKWIYEQMKKAHDRSTRLEQENAALKEKVFLHGKAFSKLMGLVRKITPNAFRESSRARRNSTNDEMGEASGVHECIQNFLEDYIDEDEEGPSKS